jgi:2,4-dienoyl-CoA reductase-like NADH-dependent reductase (Old Yellow Enzyme family)
VEAYPKITSFKTAADFRRHLQTLHLALDLDDAIEPAPDSPLAQPCELAGFTVGNRWSILPMEGWDCRPDGSPGELTERRWLRFAASGAKLLFGCEAAAVTASGRSNTRQMMIAPDTWESLARLRENMVKLHAGKFGSADDFYIGLQLTHSGRYSHPNDDHKLESITAYAHPLLDKRFGNDARNVVSDDDVKRIVDRFIAAAGLAKRAGFHFVDVKMAHGYLGHEFLSAWTRPGPYGGSFENRTRFFREIVEGIRAAVPGIAVATRLSLFDFIPFVPGPDRVGVPMEIPGVAEAGRYPYAFGGDGTGLGYDLTETKAFLALARSLGIELICTSAGSPYYVPHVQRPAYYPVSDGYLPPEDPVIGAARQIAAVGEVKAAFPDLKFIGSGYTCLQEYLTPVGQHAVRTGKTDFVGIGRMVLAYPELCADTLAGRPLDVRSICRTFGDCTTAPRRGLVSGCYPLDPFYKGHPACAELKRLKARK